MEMKMLVRIDVVEREAARAIGLELRLDLGCGLAANRWAGEDVEPERGHVAAEASAGIDEIGHALRRQHRSALDQHDMQADAQARQALRAADGTLSGAAADHEAGGRQNSLLMRELDRLVDFERE